MSGSAVRGYNEFFFESRAHLVGLAFCLTGDLEAAQGISGEVLTRAFARWRRMRSSDDEPIGWATRAVREVAARRASSSRRPPAAHPERIPGLGAERSGLLVGLSGLPAAQREAVVLRDVGGLSSEELAVELAVPEETIRSWLSAARSELVGVAGSKAGDGGGATASIDDDPVAMALRDLASFAGSRLWMFSPGPHSHSPLGAAVPAASVVARVSAPGGRWHLSLPPGVYQVGDQPSGLRVSVAGTTSVIRFSDPDLGLTWVLFDVSSGRTVTVYSTIPVGVPSRKG